MHSLRTINEAGHWLRGKVGGDLSADSRCIGPGDGFIAWPGAASDGRRFVAAALAQGASACLVERDGADAFAFSNEAIATYPQLKAATGPIAASFYGQPSHDLYVIAVTGTNGKTSTTWWIAQALSHVQQIRSPQQHEQAGATARCGLIGTLGVGVPPLARSEADPLAGLTATGLTTPDPVLLQRQLRSFVQQGLGACAIEASSIGIAEHRLDGTRLRVAVFTNFTQDHLDYHGSMAAYWQAKAALFDWPQLGAAVVNVDDAQGAALAESLRQRELDVWSVALDGPARLRALDVACTAQGMHCVVQEADERLALQTELIGRYNIANLLCVLAVLRALGVSLVDAVQACGQLTAVPGRMDCIAEPGQPLAVVDYAHTPDALEKALTALRPLAQQRGGQLICLFGCGGDRDASKRPLMAAAAEAFAHRVVVTSDNPRSEKPEAIISQIVQGLRQRERAQIEPDRAQAIAQTLRAASAKDVVLIAGKGHEATQDIGGVKQAFSDKAHARAALTARMAA